MSNNDGEGTDAEDEATEMFNNKYEKNLAFRGRIDRLTDEVDRNKDRLKNFPEYLALLNETIALCGDMRPSIRELEIRTRAAKPSHDEMMNWKHAAVIDYKMQAEQHEREMAASSRRIRALESVIVEDHLPMAIEFAIQDHKLASVPFAYYGLNTNLLIYTPATLDFLEVDGYPKELSLKGLLGNIQKGKGKKGHNVREKIFEALRKGTPLKRQKAKTIGGKDIYLRASPYHLDSEKKELVGIGIFLNASWLGNSSIDRLDGIVGNYIRSLGDKIYKHSRKDS